ncbi:ABC transporter ATP-binding protein [Halomarina litorea]|uniref:ABC transporter ATP-binding protein n=1 Tax=Halomarina litorea TaxID=2961595 RepID=UPI0034A3236C
MDEHPDDSDVIRARDIVVARGDRRILDGLSVCIPRESTTLVQGRSGAGKTTLFDVLGLLATPTEGVLEVDGTDAASLPERKRARLRRETLGFVFQDFQLIDDLSARENARLPQEHANEVDEAWLDTLFDRLELTGVSDASPRTLSGGEKQRVAIARALANRPAVVLADEPTGQLDPETTEAVLDLLLRMHREAATALVVISHDPRLAGRFDRTLVLEDGRLSASDDRNR